MVPYPVLGVAGMGTDHSPDGDSRRVRKGVQS